MVQCRVPAVIKSILAGIPQLSDPSPRYSRNIHTHTRGKPADSAGLPPSPSPCTPLVWVKESWADKKRHLWAVYGGFAWNQFRMSAKVDRLQRRVCVGDAAYDRMTFDTCYNFFFCSNMSGPLLLEKCLNVSLQLASGKIPKAPLAGPIC